VPTKNISVTQGHYNLLPGRPLHQYKKPIQNDIRTVNLNVKEVLPDDIVEMMTVLK